MPSGACCGSRNPAHHTFRLIEPAGTTHQGATMSPVSTTVNVSGITCGHCVSSVSEELEALEGVGRIDVDLNSGGISTVTITSDQAPCPPSEIGEAVPRRVTWSWPTRPDTTRPPRAQRLPQHRQTGKP